MWGGGSRWGRGVWWGKGRGLGRGAGDISSTLPNTALPHGASPQRDFAQSGAFKSIGHRKASEHTARGCGSLGFTIADSGPHTAESCFSYFQTGANKTPVFCSDLRQVGFRKKHAALGWETWKEVRAQLLPQEASDSHPLLPPQDSPQRCLRCSRVDLLKDELWLGARMPHASVTHSEELCRSTALSVLRKGSTLFPINNLHCAGLDLFFLHFFSRSGRSN